MPVASEIPKKKKPNYFTNYSGFADFKALSVRGGSYNHQSNQGGNTYLQGLLFSGFFLWSDLWSDLLMRCFHLFHGCWTRLSVLSVAAGALATVASMAAPSQAGTITFGAGANQFSMDFVTIGDPGNTADTTGDPNPAGSVGYTYDIGKFEVSRDMINKYNSNFGNTNSLVITLWDMEADGIVGGNGANRPATGISWNEAARFVNWLNTSTGNQAAYKFTTSGVNDNIDVWTLADTADYDSSNPYRSIRAKYFLPSYNEWYKAAYYSPGGTYYNTANGSDTAPTAVESGTTAGTAVYKQRFDEGPADVNQAGGLSPYGVMGLGGNVSEWEETSDDLANTSAFSSRGVRGGMWMIRDARDLSSLARNNRSPWEEASDGFRVASLSSDAVVPEPTSMAIFGLGALGMAYRACRKSKSKA